MTRDRAKCGERAKEGVGASKQTGESVEKKNKA